ncbi:MAG: HAD-IA family hydrolase [Clostridiales bacterium]|nr:HAD-IA family hydrolase [Clostridiales bacterium]
MFNNILFDLDGTLTDSFEGIANAALYALNKLGETSYTKADLNFFIGPPIFNSFDKIFKGDEQKVKRAVTLYREYFGEIGWRENRVYDGVKQMLQSLKDMGKTMAVATSKPEHFSRRITEYFDLDKYFIFVAGASMDTSRAQKAQVIEYAIKSTGINKADTVMIGDRNHDILGAKACGLKSMGVLYGYGDKEELTAAGADYIAATPEKIVEIFKSL